MNKKQLVLIAVALLLAVVIYLAPKIALVDAEKDEKEKVVDSTAFDLEKFVGDAEKQLPIEKSAKVQNYARNLADESSQTLKLQYMDSMVILWDSFRMPVVSAYYSEKYAEIKQNSESWNKAGDRYFMASRFVREQEMKLPMYNNAIRCFAKALELDSNNIDAKANLGVAYVESSSLTGQPPMKGIKILLEVVAKNPMHVNALVNLGYFSVQSGQYEKAIERFETVLKADPNFKEAYLYLADVNEKTGNKKRAIEMLDKYKKLVNDPLIKAEVDNYINELNKQ